MEDRVVNIENILTKIRAPRPPSGNKTKRAAVRPRSGRSTTPSILLQGQTFELDITNSNGCSNESSNHNALTGKKLQRTQSAHAKHASHDISTLFTEDADTGFVKPKLFDLSYGSHKQKNKKKEDKGEGKKEEKEVKKKRPESAPLIKHHEDYIPPVKAFLEPVVVSCKTGELMCGKKSDIKPMKESSKWEEIDGMTIEDLIDHDDDYNADSFKKSVPKTLLPLLPFLTEDIPQSCIGVDPAKCLIFLPSMNINEVMSLPVVPAPQAPYEELMYYESLPAKSVRKGDHKQNSAKDKAHKRRSNSAKKEEIKPNSVGHLQLFSKSGDLIMETPRGRRTHDTVRQEIKELENIMSGIGDPDDCCELVRYQADINELQRMLERTMPRVKEVERKNAEREAREHPDFFGMKEFYKEHDAILDQIKSKYYECIAELKQLETGFESCCNGSI